MDTRNGRDSANRAVRGKRIVCEALDWVGTPFMRGQSVKCVACDCAGLVVGIWREIGLGDISNLTRDQPKVPGELTLRDALEDFLVEDDSQVAMPGDIMSFAIRGIEQHLGVYIGSGAMVHSLNNRGVIRQDININWWENLRGVWRLPTWKRTVLDG